LVIVLLSAIHTGIPELLQTGKAIRGDALVDVERKSTPPDQ
jgi:hypothetical protein